MSTPPDHRDPEPPRYVPEWYDREDELDDEERAALYVWQGRDWRR